VATAVAIPQMDYSMPRLLIGLTVLMLTWIAPARADIKGNELLAQCELLEKSWQVQGNQVGLQYNDGLQCWGYLSAYFDLAYLNLYQVDGTITKPFPLSCPPNGVSQVQFVRMFLQYARNNPSELHHPASMMIMTMLWRSFPCPS
jgi:hypothetical protein